VNIAKIEIIAHLLYIEKDTSVSQVLTPLEPVDLYEPLFLCHCKPP